MNKGNPAIVKIIQNTAAWAARDLPFLPTTQATEILASYIDLLIKWNKSINLAGSQDPLIIMRDLIQDSFFLAYFLQNNNLRLDANIWDLGAGAGLPGIPLRIVQNTASYTWVESNQKRAIFLQMLQANLNLPNIHGFHGRVEKFFENHGNADFIISRAFKPWAEILAMCAPKLDFNSLIIFMANDPPPAPPAGWQIKSSFKYRLPKKDRWLWAAAKTA